MKKARNFALLMLLFFSLSGALRGFTHRVFSTSGQ